MGVLQTSSKMFGRSMKKMIMPMMAPNRCIMNRRCWMIRHHQQQCYNTRLFSASTAATSSEETNRIAIIRLYRILQRKIQFYPNVHKDDDPILLQPQLDVRNFGYHSTYFPPKPIHTEELYRLFYRWNDLLDIEMEYNDDDDDDYGWDDSSSYSSSKGSSIEDWYDEIVENMSDDIELPPIPKSKTCWTTKQQLQQAIRQVFKYDFDMDTSNKLKWSIRAIQVLSEQHMIWSNSSVATTEDIRVTATSRYIGTTSPTATLPPSVVPGTSILETKNKFAYRIRIENVSQTQYVQLLGRYWYIEETSDDEEHRPPIVVDQPNTGAVGQLPVLRPGQVFEYMSGVDLATPTGTMKGHFYMAKVAEGTISAKSGDDVESIRLQDPLEVTIAPFPLKIPETPIL